MGQLIIINWDILLRACTWHGHQLVLPHTIMHDLATVTAIPISLIVMESHDITGAENMIDAGKIIIRDELQRWA